jgi:hypothetical protein
MARAGYDPREMAAMFKTLESRNAGGPEWMSSHPNPGNRAEAILQEAERLTVSDPVTRTAAFDRLRSPLGELPRAPTTAEAIKNPPQRTSSPRTTGVRSVARVEAPSARYTEYSEGDIFSVSVPSNWREMASATSVTFAPEGASDDASGQGSFTHGVQFGVVRNGARNLRTATEELIEAIGQNNPGLGRASSWRNVTIDGRRGLQTVVVNSIDGTNQRETLRVVTAPLPDGTMLYMIAVAPEAEGRSYQAAFDRIVQSIELHD